MALDFRWVDLIHTRMLVRYGATWVRQWADVDAALVKTDWANELDGVSSTAIKHALDHLPAEFPPTAGQFRALCIRAPQYATPQLAGPRADPRRVAEEVSRMRGFQAARKPLQWAYDLQEREKAGEVLTLGQKASWRDALSKGIDTTIVGDFTPVDPRCLPPGMHPDERVFA
jgi:hypothetical protein